MDSDVSLKRFFADVFVFWFRLLLFFTFNEIFNVEIGAKTLKFVIVEQQLLIIVEMKLLYLFLSFSHLNLVNSAPLKVRLEGLLVVPKFGE